jgi:hypothetical protein
MRLSTAIAFAAAVTSVTAGAVYRKAEAPVDKSYGHDKTVIFQVKGVGRSIFIPENLS